MKVTIRQKAPSVFKLRYTLGLPGAKGDTGDVTPEATNARDAAIAARDAAIAAQVGAEAAEVQTGGDATATAADRAQTALDKAATAADRAQTGLDRTATANDRTQTGLDRVATAADRAQTGLDADDTASDRVQTGLDREAASGSAADALASALDAAASAGTVVGFQIPQGRPTLTSGVAVTTSDVVGATTIYYTPAVGNRVPLWNGTVLTSRTLTELSLALDSNSGHTGYHQAGNLFDLFAFDRSGTLTLGTGPKWTATLPAGSSSRGTGAGTTELELFNGIWVNKNTITLRYDTNTGDTVSVSARQATLVGSALMSGNGQATDAKGARYLASAFNRVERLIYRNTGTASWTYSSATPRIAEGSTDNLVPFVVCLPGDPVECHAASRFYSSGPTVRTGQTGIGLNQYATFNNTLRRTPAYGTDGVDTTNSTFGHPIAETILYAPAGYNFVAWLESGSGADTQTFVGVPNMTGLFGTLWA